MPSSQDDRRIYIVDYMRRRRSRPVPLKPDDPMYARYRAKLLTTERARQGETFTKFRLRISRTIGPRYRLLSCWRMIRKKEFISLLVQEDDPAMRGLLKPFTETGELADQNPHVFYQSAGGVRCLIAYARPWKGKDHFVIYWVEAWDQKALQRSPAAIEWLRHHWSQSPFPWYEVLIHDSEAYLQAASKHKIGNEWSDRLITVNFDLWAPLLKQLRENGRRYQVIFHTVRSKCPI